jgi:hypothetical protein
MCDEAYHAAARMRSAHVCTPARASRVAMHAVRAYERTSTFVNDIVNSERITEKSAVQKSNCLQLFFVKLVFDELAFFCIFF